jgi:splicing factor 3B subunit 1
MSDGKKTNSVIISRDHTNAFLAAEIAQIKKLQQERNALAAAKKGSRGYDSSQQRTDGTKASLTDAFDKDLYSNGDNKAGYVTSIAVTDGDEEMDDAEMNGRKLVGNYTASKEIMNEFAHGEVDMIEDRAKSAQISSRMTDYQKRAFDRATEGEDATYKQRMELREIEREEERLAKLIADKEATNGDEDMTVEEHKPTLTNGDAEPPKKKRKSRWGDADGETTTNGHAKDETPEPEAKKSRSRWDLVQDPNGAPAPAGSSRWDILGAPTGAAPAPVAFGTDIGRNSSWSDEELDMILPGEAEGYKIVEPPAGYRYTVGPRRATNGSSSVLGGFMQQESVRANMMGKELPTDIAGVGELAFFKEEDKQYFSDLFDATNDDELTVEELKKRKIKRLILKVKNGTPPMRKTALRQLTDNARAFGAGPLFSEILPLLMEKTLEDQERHLLVKVIDRILYKLDDLVRPFTHKILVVIEPLLIDQDYYARVEGREIISNLAKAAGLAHMIATMRPDIDHSDEYVRNTTARAFAVVASALGITSLLPFLRAVCRSKKSWQARHTGVKIVQQIAIQMGCAILPHLQGLVECIGENLQDEQIKVKTQTALSIAALAEAAAPYGIESFDNILSPLWIGARKSRGKGLAAFLKAVGYIIPLMDEEYANYYTEQIMEILLREFGSPDEEMKKVVLKVLSQAASTNGVTKAYLLNRVCDDFFKAFWVRRMALDKRNYRQVVDTTVDIGQKVGAGEIIERIVINLKDDSEAYRKMSLETIEKLISSLGAADVSERLEERLIDGLLYAFQEQSVEDIILLNGFGTIVNSLGTRTKQYLPQIVSTILWRLNHKSPSVRQQAADLVARVAVVIQQCEEGPLLTKIGSVLYEYLGEEYPEVLGSILGALRAIVTVVGLETMQPPVRDLLPRLTPILRNRHEKVQENTIDLVGRIADRGAESVPSREWMRICFELLDMLKAHKKGIRRAANNTFGFIAKAIGPSDVLATLLNNLRVSERQSRVCTAVAIGIVAETCQPFTVIPSLMSEYRVPELNVQNGVLKALTFVFEYIGEMSKDYVYAVTPLLEDALIDRDQVHRQTAASVVKHLALGVVGLGCEDAMLHLLNLLVPNLFETSPHVIDRIIEGIDAIRNAVGTGLVMNYFVGMLFHPARRVSPLISKILLK